MEQERRSSPRLKVNLPARWEANLPPQSAMITDLSKTGCFVLTGGRVQVKEQLRLEIDAPKSGSIALTAEVVEAADEIGFAVKFTELTDENVAHLTKLIVDCKEQNAALDNPF